MLLDKYRLDVEQTGVVEIDSDLYYDVTALWIAAAGDHVDLVKLLVEYGSQLEHANRYKSTSLRAACYNGNLIIIKFLVEHGAQIDPQKSNNSTCLMAAVYKGHFTVVEYLLSLHCELHILDRWQKTALHYAADSLPITKLLVDHGLQPNKDHNNMTLLMIAADQRKVSIVVYFVDNNLCTTKEHIEAIELLSTSYLIDNEHYSLTKGYDYMKMAMELRHSESVSKERTLLPPVEAYENRCECQPWRN
ncbi:unnamed protein product [Didymodactylos carnosus]|uniref:Protein fem-1 homolog B n=1 Tax=Didymodactylos carnosus TaxID=1234261 RepID=A0A814MS14_9BILA|nr:unnamed protein product [Didymodactylos carnosus]CAF3848911.1 unnamed protein product [Didymodactylos carnosus]